MLTISFHDVRMKASLVHALVQCSACTGHGVTAQGTHYDRNDTLAGLLVNGNEKVIRIPLQHSHCCLMVFKTILIVLVQGMESEYKRYTVKDKESVVASGGLMVIGTERHESRRIDNQLRGRSGR